MYWFPDGFTYDEREWNEPVIDDETLDTFNADKKAARMLEYATAMKSNYLSNNLFIPWGEDFAYGNAHLDFSNGDALMNYWNKIDFNSRYNINI